MEIFLSIILGMLLALLFDMFLINSYLKGWFEKEEDRHGDK